MPYFLVSIGSLILVVAALVDIISRDQSRIKHLDKVLWIFIVILMPLIGAIVWFAIGRDDEHSIRRSDSARRGSGTDHGSFGDPRRREALPARPSETERQLAALEMEIAADQNADRIRRLEAELDARGRTAGSEPNQGDL
jgi:hypothetical protein